MKPLKSSFFTNELKWLLHHPTREIRRTNLQRLYYLSPVVAILHATNIIVFFSHKGTGDVHSSLWKEWVFYGHCIMIIFAVIGGLTAFLIEKKGSIQGKLSILLPKAISIIYLLFGIYITTIEQPIYPTITPFLLASVGIGIFLLIPPVISLLTYTIAYIIFFLVIQLTQLNPELLLSVQVRGLTSICLGLGIAIFNWRNHVIQIKQSKYIVAQNKSLERKNKKLINFATYDALTGLYNRMKFMSLVSSEVEKMKRFNHSACLIILDIDCFKSINDQYGHPVGDVLLRRAGKIITDCLDNTDIAARVGGEEFMILLPNNDVNDGQEVAEKIRVAFEAFKIDEKGIQIGLTASFGVAPLIPYGSDPFQLSYNAADKALYRAKNSGKNRIEVSEQIQDTD